MHGIFADMTSKEPIAEKFRVRRGMVWLSEGVGVRVKVGRVRSLVDPVITVVGPVEGFEGRGWDGALGEEEGTC
jgi:hypothetical protein